LAAANEQRAVFQRFAEAAGQGFGMADLEGNITYLNQAMCHILGVQKPEDVIGQHVSTYYTEPPVTLQQAEEILLGRPEGHWSDERMVISRQGTPIPAIHANFLVRDGEGKPSHLAVVITDITERKNAEEALRQAHDELRAIYDNMVDGLLIAACETGRLLPTNPAMCRMLGYSADELLSMTVKAIHPAEAVPSVLEKFRTQQEGQRLVTQDRPMLRKDGTVFYADISNVRISYQGRACLIGIFRDMTERKQAREALRQSHDELQAIYDQAVDGIIIVDAEAANPVRANAAFCGLLGYSEEEVRTISPERVHSPEVLPSVWKHLEAVKKGNIARIDDLPFVRKDGGIVYADVVTSPILYNKRSCWISFFHDVTERKQAQVALERERQSLWRMLQASDHERQIISYDIHDGLAQYLAAAGMQLQVFDGLRESNPDEAKKAYDAATQLVRQSHSESRRLISEVRPPVIDEIGLETAISHLVHEQRRRGGPKIECHSSVQFGRLPPIVENALYRIVQEALTNACKHSKSKKVTVTMTQEGQDVRLEVRDWGIGFNPEAVGKGHFGLEGIRQRVRLLGGRLTIESTPDFETLIQVVVPIVERQSQE
jgi:PAS domain S-box-containing protein